MSSSKTSIRAVACVAGLGLMFVQAALAAEQQPIRFNATDQAAAKAVTLKAADVGAGWKGGVRKPDLVPDDMCAIKRSDLVLTGAAKSEFKTPGALISSESNVLETPSMVGVEWKRSFGSSAWVACGRKELTKMSTAKVRFVSFKKVPFPKLAQYTVRYRMLTDYGETGSAVRVLVDVIVLGQGRTEISLIVSTPYADRAAADLAERRLAQLLVDRIAA